MEAELVALATAAATTVVKLLATATWEKVRTAVAGLWRRAHPDRAGTVEAELTETRDQLLAGAGDDAAEADLVGEWRGRLRRLLTTNPELAAELRRLLDEEWTPALRGAEPSQTTINISAVATDHGRVYQAGRDQNIGKP